jgi:hypothetical protein
MMAITNTLASHTTRTNTRKVVHAAGDVKLMSVCVFTPLHAAACSITELQDQFGVAHETTAHQLPHMAASVAVMAVPGVMAWAADTSMRLAYNSGPLKAAAKSAITGSLQMAGATAASVTSIASLGGPLVPFINLSYGYLPLVRD